MTQTTPNRSVEAAGAIFLVLSEAIVKAGSSAKNLSSVVRSLSEIEDVAEHAEDIVALCDKSELGPMWVRANIRRAARLASERSKCASQEAYSTDQSFGAF